MASLILGSTRNPFSQRASTVKKMNKYGGRGSEDEWRANDADPFTTTTKILPSIGRVQVGEMSNAPRGDDDDATKSTVSDALPEGVLIMQSDQAKYIHMLRISEVVRRDSRDYVERYWWDDLCRTANNEVFHEVLFDRHLFDDEGVLDRRAPAYRRIKLCLALVYLHIVEKFGESSLSDWKLTWEIDQNSAPFLRVTNTATGHQFGMLEPKSGFHDSKNELKALRARRDNGKPFQIPADKLRHYTRPTPTLIKDSKRLPDSDSDMTPEMAKALLEQTILEEEDNDEDWTLIEHEDADLVFDDTADDEVIDDVFAEARIMGQQNDGYQYKREDSKPGRKGWKGWIM
ncbi:hypothetical protein K504DRAFT_529967 [Pleomassaria siparia CBS 279.74]|uniref:Uncharacterized protein n=1 Tax=Pleomassaria siparia CBS 279.74 TaxID=1314801 RepID=A0A6G1KJB9_9PLEO|nr:hypothetical protein K504DRAFT_529967 [Pleomassaria siparia CBS 279.74]